MQTGGPLTVWQGPSYLTAAKYVKLFRIGNSIIGPLIIRAGLAGDDAKNAMVLRHVEGDAVAKDRLAKDSTHQIGDKTTLPLVLIELLDGSEGDRSPSVSVEVLKVDWALKDGFRFALLDQITRVIGETSDGAASLPDGQPLPDWLTFDPISAEFKATTVPSDSLPIELVVAANGYSIPVTIRAK